MQSGMGVGSEASDGSLARGWAGDGSNWSGKHN
jgi:hypothetical protein